MPSRMSVWRSRSTPLNWWYSIRSFWIWKARPTGSISSASSRRWSSSTPGQQRAENQRRLEGVAGGFQRVHPGDVGFLHAGDVARAEQNVVDLARAGVGNIAKEMGQRGVAHGGGEIGGAERIDRHGEEDVAHDDGHVSAHAGRAVDLAQPFLDQLVEGRQAAAALGLVDDVVVDQDEGVEQFEGKRGPQERVVLEGPVSAKDAVGSRAAAAGGCACRAAPTNSRDVEVERLEQFAVGVTFGVFLEEAGQEILEKSRRSAAARCVKKGGARWR